MINTSKLAAALLPAVPAGGISPNVDPAAIVDDDDHKAKPVPRVTIAGGSIAPDVDPSKIVTGPNYTPTKDPNVVIGRNGVLITKAQFAENQKSQMPFNDFHSYADWVGSWSQPMNKLPQISPYYRTYPAGKISGLDIFNLYRKNDPTINKILDRNIAKPGEVPLYGSDDADSIRTLIAKTSQQPQ